MIQTGKFSFLLEEKKKGKEIGLITGCFDILHEGHKSLFSFAKKHCDFLVVGVESNKTIRLSKGKGRPINSQKVRIKNLKRIKEVDYVFPININVTFGDKNVAGKYLPLIKKIKPDYLITNIVADKYWQEKEKAVMGLGIKLLKQREKIPISTTQIISSFPSRNHEIR